MTTDALIEDTLSKLATLGWASDVTSDEEDAKRWEVRSPKSNMVDLTLQKQPPYEGGFVGVQVCYLGEEYMETFAELPEGEVDAQALLAALHGAALKDAELKALGK